MTELRNWVAVLKDTKIKEFKECIRAFTNWKSPIINGIIYEYSNGLTEGKNNKTKVIKRFRNLRKRILIINNKIPNWAV